MLSRVLSFSITGVLLGVNATAHEISPMPEAYCDGNGTVANFQCELARAMRAEDDASIRRIVREAHAALGDELAVPEAPDNYSAVPETEPPSNEKLAGVWGMYLDRIQQDPFWRNHPKPQSLPGPLRGLSDFVVGMLAARRAGLDPDDRGLAMAHEMGDYLLWAQEQGGAGVFGVPDLRGKTGRVPELVTRFLAKADAARVTDRVLKNGWLIDDWGGGDLQFDNGLAGAALLQLYGATGESRYLDSARSAGEWAISQPCVPNWNYNSFSVYLLAELYRVTGEARYLESAERKTRIGVLPGLILEGPKAGRWGDPHNARLVYHYILCRGMAALLSAMPGDDPEREILRDALVLALKTRNTEIIEKGVANPDTVLEVLSRVMRDFGSDETFVTETRCDEALAVLQEYVASQLRKNQLPVGAGAMGLYSELMMNRGEN